MTNEIESQIISAFDWPVRITGRRSDIDDFLGDILNYHPKIIEDRWDELAKEHGVGVTVIKPDQREEYNE